MGILTFIAGALTIALSGWIIGMIVPDLDARENPLLRTWRVLLLGASAY